MSEFSHTLKKVFLFVFSFIFLSAMAKNPFAAESNRTKTVRMMGTGVHRAAKTEDDTAKAREKAISNGLFLAVEVVATDILPPDSLIQSFNTLNKIFYSDTSDFILGYRVLTEARFNKLYRVLVEANVSIDKLQERFSDAGIIIGKKTMPKLLFLISEHKIGDFDPQYWWDKHTDNIVIDNIAENVMAETMRRKGLYIIEHGAIQQDPNDQTAVFNSELDNPTAVQLGILFQADIVIVGKSTADQATNTMGEDIKSFKGLVSARALRTDTGVEIMSTIQTYASVNTDEMVGGMDAIIGAGTLAAENLAPRIISGWQNEDKKSGMVEIIVEGTNYFANFVKFRKVISKLSGVKAIQNKGMKPTEAVILVDFEGDANELAQALMLKTFDSFGVKISDLSQDRFKVLFVPN